MDSRACAAALTRKLSSLYLYIFVFLSCSLIFTLCGCSGGTIISTAASASSSSLRASPNTVSFGGVALGTTASQTVSLENQGTAAVTVSQVSVSGQPFSVSGEGDLPITVAAGGTYSLSVNFSPSAAGTAAGQLTIGSNATTDGTLTIGLSGVGTAAGTADSPELSSFNCVQATMTGAGTDSCTVTLSAAAASGGFAVNLASNNSAVTVPGSVTVSAGSTTGSFTATVSAVSTAQAVTLTASAGGVTETFALQLNAGQSAPVLSGLSCSNGSMTGAGTDSCAVALSAAATGGGFAVNLASNNSAVKVPASVTVSAGSTTGSFTATVSAVNSAQTVTLTATAGGVAKTFALQLNAGQTAPVLSGLNCSSGSMTGAGTDSCTVTLSAAAAGRGFAVNLASNNSAVTVPGSVTVSAGSTTGSFTATVSAVSTAQTVTLTASAGGVAETFALQLVAGVPTLSINATSIAFGDVNLNSPATQSMILTSTGTAAVTVSAATVTGSGFTISGASFPITLKTNQAATLSVQFDPTVAGTASGTLTIVSTSLTNPIAIIGLSGTGVGVAYEVNLSWNAPTTSPDPVAGYNVYRSPDGASMYQQVNTGVVTQTTYVDTGVEVGKTYDYIVESVDASGVTSSPSNVAVVPIP